MKAKRNPTPRDDEVIHAIRGTVAPEEVRAIPDVAPGRRGALAPRPTTGFGPCASQRNLIAVLDPFQSEHEGSGAPRAAPARLPQPKRSVFSASHSLDTPFARCASRHARRNLARATTYTSAPGTSTGAPLRTAATAKVAVLTK